MIRDVEADLIHYCAGDMGVDEGGVLCARGKKEAAGRHGCAGGGFTIAVTVRGIGTVVPFMPLIAPRGFLAGVGLVPILKRGPPPPRPPLSSLGGSGAGSVCAAPSSRSESPLFHWAFLRERPIFRSPRSTRRILTSISSPTLTISSGLSTLWSASSEMWSSPSRPGSSSTNTPKLVSLVTLPFLTSFGS